MRSRTERTWRRTARRSRTATARRRSVTRCCARPLPGGVRRSRTAEVVRVVDLEKVRHLDEPPLIDEAHVLGMLVVAVVGRLVGELHRDPVAIGVLGADLAHELERLDAGKRRQTRGRLEKAARFVRPLGVDEPERNRVPDAFAVERHGLDPGTGAGSGFWWWGQAARDGSDR